MSDAVQLVVAATSREADAIVRDLDQIEHPPFDKTGLYETLYETRQATGVIVVVSGIGMSEAAAATAHIIATREIAAVFSIGVAGGWEIPIGAVAVGTTVMRADTGIEEADGSVRTTKEAIGIGDSGCALGNDRVEKVAARLPGSTLAHVLTVATVTGTTSRAERVLARRPGPGPAVEDMEAWGVLTATRPYDLPFFAVKAISNAIGPRDRSAWDLEGALDTLSVSAAALFRDPPDWT